VSTGVVTAFPCSQWLRASTSGPDRHASCSITLRPGELPDVSTVQYSIIVETSAEKGSGTDANVSIVLIGDSGDSGSLKLESSANDFERGARDVFLVAARDIGVLKAIQVRSLTKDSYLRGT
jgi:lipoxygenase homology domain-containing protein 1